MTIQNLSDKSQSQRERLYFIDFRLFFLGKLNRQDLTNRFGIKEAAATRDITEYRKLKPDNIQYDHNEKSYLKLPRFSPLFEYDPQQALFSLSGKLVDDFTSVRNPLITCESLEQLVEPPDIEILSVLSNAIYLSKAITIEYHSLSSGKTSRELVPFALIDNGLRWHIRGFDRKRKHFGDFVLTRITKARIIESVPLENENREFDIQWNRIVELELVPHPRINRPRAIELDHKMQDGMFKLNVRAALAGYLLRRMNVDCSPDHSLVGDEYQLWLRNSLALYGVENLKIAPGHKSPDD